ncbi:hypothetical protein Lal_00031378 [Lupinus albus]|uniref:Putative transcription factor SBP family n=1 Tax=Lupinus albus TaxID=3870 RepID=A0A6A4P1A2_LUPAL|nr:putative transcription factor SBP family [Lupinus albus]KAF1863293.1 hypothetical protein Lal_00031378 [Lupinus albus]
MENLAPPIFQNSSLTTNNKRDLSYHLFQQTPNHTWNPNSWNWDSNTFLAKPFTQNNNNIINNNINDEETLDLNLGGPNKKLRSDSTSATASYPMCQVHNCTEDLSTAKDYHRRHKVCEVHSKASKALVADQLQRFCQQCSRFHPLSEFDEGKRSCRRRLAGHNRRRRKTQPEDVTSMPEKVTTGNMEIVNLLTAIAGSQGNFEEISKIGSQVSNRDHLVQMLNRMALPADLASKLLNVGNFNEKGHVQTSSYDHDKLNQNDSGLFTKDLLASLSSTLSTPVPDATASLSQNCSQSSDSEKSRTSADQIVEANLQTRQPPREFSPVRGERSSGSSQSPVEDSDCPEVRVNLPLQLFSCSPEDECLRKMVSSQKYFSSDSSNPLEERSPSSSPPAVEKQLNLQGVTRGLKPGSFSIRREVNVNKEVNQSLSFNISLDHFNELNSRIQPGSLKSLPIQPGYASSGSDHSPPSLNSDAQDRTGRIMFKLFGKDPSHFPGTLRTQIYNWLSSRPSDLESYIRPGCVVLSVYATMSLASWDELEDNFLQRVHSLIQNSDSDFWRNARFLVHFGSRLASHKDGKIRLCNPWRKWRSPELLSVSPLAIVSGQETSISLKGRNLSIPGTKIHCTGTDCYTSEEIMGSAYHGMTHDKMKLSAFKVQNVSGVLGRCFIEVENGFKGDSFPVIIADATICKELIPLESEFDSEDVSDEISDGHENNFGRPRSREEALHFLNELGWLFQRERFSDVHEVTDYSLDRFKFVLTFAVERNCCMLVKTLLDVLVDKHLEGESLSEGSVDMLNAIQLLNRAVKRQYTAMVDLLICYSLPSKSVTLRRYIFPPNIGGPDGITPLHLAASTPNSESVVDSLTNDPQEIGLTCWESLVDANGKTPHAYATMRNNHSYNVLVTRKRAEKQRGQVSVTIDNEIQQPSLRIELNRRQSYQLERGKNSCAKCVIAEIHSYRRVSASRGSIKRPFIHSVLAVAAVCVCVCLFMRGTPSIGSVAPFRWEKLDYGTH